MIKLRAMATKVGNKSGWLLYITAVLILVIVCVQACQRPTRSNPSHQQPTSTNVFDSYLHEYDVSVGQGKGLGGGIGFHGWIKEWDNNGPRHLSWGCVVMHIYDIQKLYDQIPEGTMVVIL